MYNLRRINFRLFLQSLIGIGIMFILFNYIQSQGELFSIFWQFNFSRLFPVSVVILVHIAVLYYMWKSIILDVGGMNPHKHLIFHSFFGGRTLGFITPGQMGELLKGLFFSADSRIEATSLSMIYAGYGFIVHIVFGCVGCVYFIIKSHIVFNFFFDAITFSMIMLFLGIIIILLLKRPKIIIYIGSILPKQVTEIFSFIKNQVQTNSVLNLFKLFLLALAANLLVVFAFMLLLEGFNIYVFSIDGLMAFEAAYLAMYLLPITPSAIGVREGSRLYFFSLIGCSPAPVLWASFIMFGLNIIFPAIIGIWSLKHFWPTLPQIK